MSEWDALIDNFNKHKYKVIDCTDKEFVGIKISRDNEYNYFMDQHRMIDDIIKELNVTGAKGERLPYPMDLPKVSRKDNASSVSEQIECGKYPYSRVVWNGPHYVWNGPHYGDNNVRTKRAIPIQ